MNSKGEQLLGKAIKSKAKRSVKKRGMVAAAVGAYSNATKGLQNVGKGIRTGVSNAVNTRIAQQNAFNDQMAAGNKSNYYGTAGTFKRKRSQRK